MIGWLFFLFFLFRTLVTGSRVEANSLLYVYLIFILHTLALFCSKDPITLLLTLIMYLHPHFTPLHFDIVVQSVFNLAFVRGAINVATKLSKEERGAWQRVRRETMMMMVRMTTTMTMTTTYYEVHRQW